MLRLIFRAAELAEYALQGRTSFYYVGWVGYSNFGDEVLLDAVRERLAPLKLACVRAPAHPKALVAYLEKKAHAGIVLGGGTLIGPPNSARRHFFENFEFRARAYGNSLVFGSGVAVREPSRMLPWLEKWKPLLKQCKFIGVRGPESQEALRLIGVDAEVIGDPAMGFVQPAGFWQPVDRRLGVNYGVLPEYLPASAQADLDQHLSDFIRRRREEGWDIDFFCIWPGDRKAVERLADSAGIRKPIIHHHYWDASRYLQAVRRSQVFVGLKLHSVVLAMCAGVPSVSLEYLPKCRDYMKSVMMDRLCLPLSNISDLDAFFEQAMAEGQALSTAIVQQLTHWKGIQESAAARVLEMLKSSRY